MYKIMMCVFVQMITTMRLVKNPSPYGVTNFFPCDEDFWYLFFYQLSTI